MGRYSWIINPRRAAQTYYETWSSLVGPQYAKEQQRVFVRVMTATLVMGIGCVIAFGLAIGFGIAEDSLNAALMAMIAGSVVVFVGYGLLKLALLRKNELLADKESIVLRVDSKRTQTDARLILTQPNLAKQWLAMHPNAFADPPDER